MKIQNVPQPETGLELSADEASNENAAEILEDAQQETGDLAAAYAESSSHSSMPASIDASPAASKSMLLCLAPAALIITGLGWIMTRMRRRTRTSKQQQHPQAPAAMQEPAPTLAVYASDFRLLPQPSSSPRPAPLEGLKCVVAENVAMQGAVLGCGIPDAWHECPVASETAPAVQKLLNVGAVMSGQGSVQPLNYPTQGDNIRNPTGRFRLAGGGCTGAVAAVALDEAELAVGTDYLGSLRLPAAAMGVFGFVGTPGTMGPADPAAAAADPASAAADPAAVAAHIQGPASPNSINRSGMTALENVGLVSSSLHHLCHAASCLGLPGSSNLRHEVTQVVVAEDLFQLCEAELGPAVTAVKRAVLSWAGQEQAGSVQLLQFIEGNTGSWHHLNTGGPTPSQDSSGSSSSKPMPACLSSLSRAAALLHHSHLWQQYGNSVSAAAVEQAHPAVAAALREGALIPEQQLHQAQAVAREVQAVLKGAVKKEVVVVLPCVPAAPPKLDAPDVAIQSWVQRSRSFACITALGGCPSVVLPVGQLSDGAPLALALFGAARTDQRLLAVADKLMPHIVTEALKIQRQAMALVAPPNGAHAAQHSKASRAGTAKPKKQAPPAEADPRRAERAERAKAKGNAAFQAGRYTDAIKAYSQALALQPANPIYANNRAMAYLKVFSFEAAEADCNRALASPVLAPADRVKALLRRGTARMHKGDLRGARTDFREVLSSEPHNRQAQEELKSLNQQELDMESTRRQQALAAAAAAAAAANGGSPHALGDLPEGLSDMAGLDAESFVDLLHSSGMPVLLGQDGQAVHGPGGAPVVVGPDGAELTIEQSGRLRPYRRG